MPLLQNRQTKSICMTSTDRRGDKPLLHLDTDTNPDCGIGINIQFAIGDFYHEIQNMVDEKMKSITLQDIIDRYYFKIRKVKSL